MLLLRDITNLLESFASLSWQENYDNSGLIVGDKSSKIKGALISLDVTEEVIQEAIDRNCNLIIAHHPFIFGAIKKVSNTLWNHRILIQAIKNDIAIYAIHTNLDNVLEGVNQAIANKIGLIDYRILRTSDKKLKKLVTYVPVEKADFVLTSLFSAGAGHIGHYSECSFSLEGSGTFKGNEKTSPFVGIPGQRHTEKEVRMEVVLPSNQQNSVLTALIMAHPYEEVAYDLYTLDNHWANVGAGGIGKLPVEMPEKEFLNKLRSVFNARGIRYSKLLGNGIKKVAFCGGAGSFLMQDAIDNQTDVFITADLKYHQFFDADNRILLVDIGHFESEQFTSELIFNQINKKFPTFAAHLSKTNTNPVNYLG